MPNTLRAPALIIGKWGARSVVDLYVYRERSFQASAVDRIHNKPRAFTRCVSGDVMAKDAPGWTPLHKAAIVGKKNAVHALIEAGAAIEARASISGRTPLHEACAYLQSDLVSQLLLLGADEDAVDADSQTPDDVVGRSVLARNVQADDTIRLMLKGAPAARRWRRRSLLILLRSRQFPTDYEEGESAKDGGIVLPLSPQLTHPVTIAREGNASQQHGEDLRFLTSGALALPEGVFRTVVLFL